MLKVTKQIELLSLANFFYDRSGAEAIVIITDDPKKLIDQFPEGTRLYMASGAPATFSNEVENVDSFTNTSFIKYSKLNQDFLIGKLLVCLDPDKPAKTFSVWRNKRLIKRISDYALISIISTQSKNVGKNKLKKWLPLNEKYLIGYSRELESSTSKDRIVALTGQLINFKKQSLEDFSVLAIIHVFNEIDVIENTIKHLLDQGLDVHIIDNWSTDGSYEVVKSLAKRHAGITFERFPKTNIKKFELKKMLQHVDEVAKEKKNYNWFTLNDADEIRWSPWKGVTLKEAFSFIDSMGYNAVDYTVFNLVPTRDGFNQKDNLLTFFNFGEFGGLSGYFVQVKSWKYHQDAALAPSGGHHISFSGVRIFPLKFLLCHYPIRSSEHGLKKVFKERLPRFSGAERTQGWHIQYDKITKDTSFIKGEHGLIKYNGREFDENYIIERLSGIGIPRDEE